MKTFTVNSQEYAAPEQLGQGYDVIEYETTCQFFLRSHPEFIDHDMNEEFDAALEEWKATERDAIHRDVAIYKAFLRPLNGARPIDEIWYLEASPQDLKPINDFFEQCFRRKMGLLKHNMATGETSPNA